MLRFGLRNQVVLGRRTISVINSKQYSTAGDETGHSSPMYKLYDTIPFEPQSAVSGVIATIFGSTGFLGRYVVGAVAEQGAQIIVPYRGTENCFRHLRVLGDLGQVVAMGCDVWKPDQVEEVCSQSNVVINLIGSRWDTKNFSMYDTNHQIAENIAKGAKNAGVNRIIHVSALGADENAPSDFGKSKWMGEQAVKEVFPDATILRPSTLFGYEDHLLNKWAGVMKFWPTVPLIEGTLERKEAPLAATDLSDCIKKCTFDAATIGKTYELQGPDVMTQRELLDLVRRNIYSTTRETPVPLSVFRTLVGITSHFAKAPRFTKDEVTFSTTDNLVNPEARDISELLDTDPIKMSAVAIRFIRHFRNPEFIHEL